MRGGPQYEWQLLTYAELRRRKADALPVAAGVLIYVNELYPTATDLRALKNEVKNGYTDVVPRPASPTAKALAGWSPRGGCGIPNFPLEYRLERARRVVPVSQAAIDHALGEFDKIVERIETCRGRELHGTPVIGAWDRNPSDESTCAVCDSRTYCPDFITHYAKQRQELSPRLPGLPARPRQGDDG